MKRLLFVLALLVIASPALAAVPQAPTIAYPTASLTGVFWNPVVFWSHCTYSPASNLTCANADLQITTAADTGFADPIWDSYNDLGDAFSLHVTDEWGVWKTGSAEETANSLQVGTNYIARVRQQGRILSGTNAIPDTTTGGGTGSGWSNWSATVAFTTRVAYSGSQYYVRTDGNDSRCTGLVDAADTGSGSAQPCAKQTWNGIMAVPPAAGSRIRFKNEVNFGGVSSAVSVNRLEIYGESKTGSIIRNGATVTQGGPPTGWLTFSGDDLYIHDLTLRGASCSATDQYNNLTTWSTSNRAVVKDVVFDCNVSVYADDGAVSSGMILWNVTDNGQRENTQYTNGGTPQALQFGGDPPGRGFPNLAIIDSEFSGFRNIQSSTGSCPDHLHFEDVYWHNASNHTMEIRGAREVTYIRPRWKRNAASFGESIRGTCDTGDNGSPRRTTKYVTIINGSGDDQMFFNTDNCTAGQAASVYDIGYLSEVNTIHDDSDTRTSSSTTSGIYLGASSTANTGFPITSSTQFHFAYNARRDAHGKTLIQVFRPASGAEITVAGSSGAFTTWKGTAFFSASAYTPDFGSLYMSSAPLTNTQGGDFTPLQGSVVIDAGDPNVRVPSGGGTRIDIGAVEFVGQSPLASVSVGDVSVDEAAGLMNFPVNLSAATSSNTTFDFATSDLTALGLAQITLENTTEAHAITRGHNRKLVWDANSGRWFFFYLIQSGGFGACRYISTADGVTWSSPATLDAAQGAGFTAFSAQMWGNDILVVMRSAYTTSGYNPLTPATPDKLVVRRLTISGSTLTIAETAVIHDCIGVCSDGAGTTSAIHFYGDILRDAAGVIWVVAMVEDGGATSHVELIRTSAANNLDTWGASGCDAKNATTTLCNGSWVTPTLTGGLAWGQGEKGCTLHDTNAGVTGSVGVTCYDKGSDGVPSAGQILWSFNAAGTHNGWANWIQLTNQVNRYQTSGSGGDTTRLDDRRYSCVTDPATGTVHCVYIRDDTGTSAQANILYFTLTKDGSGTGTPFYGTLDKTSDVTVVGPNQETDGCQLAIDTRPSPAKLDLFYVENQHPNYTMKLLTDVIGSSWPAASTALTISGANGRRQYPQVPETITQDAVIAVLQENDGSGAYDIKARKLSMTSAGVNTYSGDFIDSDLKGSISAGSTQTLLRVPIRDDSDAEATETLRMTVSNVGCLPAGSCTPPTLLDGLATGTITDNDSPVPDPTVSFTTAAQTNSEATTSVTVSVTLSAASASTITVPFTISGSSTATGGGSCAGATDYVTPSSPITITGGLGLTTGSVAVTVCNDVTDETPPGTETVIFNMGSPTNATQGAITTHTMTIQDNDDAAVSVLTVSDVTVSESAGTATFHVLLTPASAGTVTVLAATADDSAIQPDDYLSNSQTLTFAASDTSEDFVVSIVDDTLHENAEQFLVNLSGATGGATIGDAQAIGLIPENDIPQGVGTTLSDVILGDVIVDGGSTGLPPPFTIRSVCTSTFNTGVIATDLAAATVTCSPAFAGSTCYQITITGCSGKTTTIGAITADIRYRPRDAGTGDKGLLVMLGGGTGAGFLDGTSATAQSFTTAAAARGYATAVIKFGTGTGSADAGWTQTSAGNADGHRRLAGRVATAAKWVADHLQNAGTPLGCVGSSIGSTGCAELCQQYGFCQHQSGLPHFDWLFLGSGPVMTRLDEGCSDPSLAGGTPAESDFGYPPAPAGKGLIDGTFCAGATCCSSYDPAFTADFIADEQRSDDQLWTFNSTQFVGLRAGNDSPVAGGCTPAGNCTNAPNHQAEWFAILATRSPLVALPVTIAGCDHTYMDTVACRNFVLTAADDPVTGMQVRP